MSGHKLNLLSIDGGGIKGLSALYLLKKLMELIDFEDPPKPCEVFDMIGGTSTGGWIAIMLGRLDMTVDEYITSFLNLQRRIFQHDAPEDLLSEERLDDNAVEVGFKELIRERGLQPDCLLKDGTALCKVFVTATRAGPSTEMLSSYYRPRGSSELYQHTKIWQAARATSAASGFFGLIEIGPAKRRFADGGAGANNPVEKLWEEMEDLLGPGVSLQDNLNCIVSLGTGIKALEPISCLKHALLSSLVNLATETEATAERFHRSHSHLYRRGVCYRFSAPSVGNESMNEPEIMGDIAQMTDHYISRDEIFSRLRACSMKVLERKRLQSRKRNLSNDADMLRVDQWSLIKHDWTFGRASFDMQRNISRYDPQRAVARVRSKIFPGTAQWLFQSPVFCQWIASPLSPLLLFNGIIGSGKTLCSANTVHHLQQGAHGVQEVYHFLFDQSATGARDAVAAVNALIKQILDRHSHQARQLCSIINTYYGPGTEQSTLEEICENVFLPLICSLASPVLLIDGLDLCDTVSLPDLVRVLLLSARNGAKVLIAARGREILAFKTRELSFIEIEISRRTPGVEEELHSVIGKAIALKRIRHSICSETMIDTITSHLLEKVGVMILWAALLLDEIWTDCIDDASITLYLLEHLPENLKATYLRCVERLSATRGSLSQRILVAVCASTEPFQMEELRDYLALREVDGALQTEPEHRPNAAMIIECGANLITVDDTEEYVQPIHHSVIQHIIPETERTSAELETGKFCLLYLQASTAVVPLEKPKPRKSRMTVGVPGGLPTRALRLVSGRDVIVSPLYVPPRPPGLRGLGSKHGGSFLDYAQRAWVQSNRHIAPTDDLQWRLFSNMALDNSGTLDLPWPCERSSPFSQLTGLFLWAITHEHGPLLALALSEQERRSWPGTHQDLRRLAVSIDDQGSVQHFVAKQGRRKIFKILLHPAYLLDRDARGNTTLHVASLHGNQGILDEFYSYAEQRGVGHTQAWRNDFLSVQRNLPSLPQSQEKERWRLHVSWQSKARTDSVTGTQNDQMSFRFDILNDEGETPLHMAVLGGRLQSVITVYTKSLRCSVLACPVGHADVHTVEGLGWMRKSDNSGSLPIHHAVANGSIRLFKYCHTELHRLPDPTNSVPSTKTLLRHALRNTQWTMAMFMLKHHSSELEGWAVDICSTLRVWGPQGLIVFLWNTCYPTLVDHGCELEDDQATWSIQQFFADFDLFHHIHPHIYEIPSMLLLAAMTRQSHLLSCLAHMHPKAFLSSIISKDGVLRYFFWLPLYQRTRGSSYQSGKKHTVNDQNLFDSIVDHMQSQLRRQSGYRRNGLTDLLLASSHLHDRQSFYAAIVLTQRIPLGLFKELQNSGRGDDCNLLKNVAWSLDGDFVKRRIERHELWLWILATQGDEDAVHSFLSHHVIKIFDICCARGTSPIWQACMRGHITVAKLLLENGAYSNSKVRNTRPVPRHPDSNSQELEVPAGLTPDEVLARYHGMLDLFDTTRSTTTFGQRYHAVQVNQQPVELEATPFIPRVSWGTSNQLSWIKAQMLPAWPPL